MDKNKSSPHNADPAPREFSPREGWTGRLTSRSPLKLGALALATAALLAVHYAVDPNSAAHDFHRQLLFIPIVLAAFWYGWRGGAIAAVVLSLAYFPHLLMLKHVMMGHGMTENLNARLLEAFTYVVIGALTGSLIDRLRLEERRLRQANKRLEEQSGQLRAAMDDLTRKTREVFESEEQLRRADRLAALGQLTAGLAHEIRNPLASIRGAAEILGDAAIGPDQREEFSRILTEETHRLDQVLSTFLDYARAQKAEAAEAADLRRVVDQVAALLGRQLADAGLSLDVRIPADLPPLALGEGLLQQVLVNLLLNALQATPRGGRITLAAEADRREKQALLRVGDSGPGIAREAAEHIFDPFFTTKRRGLGLGLSIVHKIISNTRGEIRLDPAWTGGAGFIIRLPLA